MRIIMSEEDLSDKIASVCLDLYNKLGKTGKPIQNKEWTLLSGIVLDIGGELEVVSLATGTKCIGANAMRSDGSVVNDSHAEVLARRALKRFILEEMRTVKCGGSSKVIDRCESKFIVKEGVNWHMYSSQVPCGDASIIPMEDLAETEEPVKKRQKVDIYRTGGKPVKGESRQDPKMPGVEYHTRGAVRIKPGRGDPTLSLSCSDKIARWIYTGLQGGLLSLLLTGDIRLTSLVIGGGGPYNHEIISTSLIKRSSPPGPLPKILQASRVFPPSLEKDKGGRPAPASIIWSNVKEKAVEVCVEGRRQGSTAKDPLKGALKVSKRELFKLFLSVTQDPQFNGLTYRQVKERAVLYQIACKEFKKNMGSWSDKPLMDNFLVDSTI